MSTPQATRPGILHHTSSDTDLDLPKVDARLQEEMRRLAAINQDLLGNFNTGPKRAVGPLNGSEELDLLRAENAELRSRVEELEQALQNDETGAGPWSERQKEYETLLEEKSEIIRSLHLRLQQQEEGKAAPGAAPANPDDLQQLQKELEEQRRQLEEDEATVMKQMRDMEMAMSKERAEIGRQRNEIQRLHNDLNREIEMASRDPALRERLSALQRLQGEMSGRKQTAPPPQTHQPAEAPPAQKAVATSGLFRRIFGK